MYIINTTKKTPTLISVHKVYLLVAGFLGICFTLFTYWPATIFVFFLFLLYIYETTPRMNNGFFAFSSTIDNEELRLLIESYFSEEISYDLKGVKCLFVIKKSLTGLLRKKTHFYEIYLVYNNDKIISTKIEYSTLKSCMETAEYIANLLNCKVERYIETGELYSRKTNNHFYVTLFQKNLFLYEEISKNIILNKLLISEEEAKFDIYKELKEKTRLEIEAKAKDDILAKEEKEAENQLKEFKDILKKQTIKENK